MGDTMAQSPDPVCLFAVAASQQGHFTTAQARECGYDRRLVAHHTGSGRFLRVRRGLYRFRDYAAGPQEATVAAWLALGRESAVVSHVSALDLLGLGDFVPDMVHLSVPRRRRHLPALPGVVVHTTTRPFAPLDLTVRDGLVLTSARRSILDAAAWGVAPEQVVVAVRSAVQRGLVTPDQLRQDASRRSRRVARLIEEALREPVA